MSFLLYFQLHNMTLAFDLLRDTGFEVSNVNPQGEEITLLSLKSTILGRENEKKTQVK